MEEGVISAVNLSEVASKLAERGAREDSIRDILGELGLSAVPFDETLAYRAASLRRSTQALGLSLGDRACLATAALLGVRAVTADRAWEKLKLPVKVVVVR
jgi:PIN domain nuclease of toxin-antitoxin system